MTWFLLGMAALAIAAVVRLVVPWRAGRPASLALVLAGCAAAGGTALRVLAGGPGVEWSFPTTLPGGPWLLRLDPLAAWFVVPIVIVGACGALFGSGTFARERRSGRVATTEAMMPILLGAMALVVTAQAVVPFLIAWETMAIAGLLLILHEGERVEVRRSALVYLVATHAATLALVAMFALWGSQSPDLTFPSLQASLRARPEWCLLVLPLGLLGFGIKAGMIPLHSWLPGAHSSAPSHVSAVLSGVMIKTGIYGLLRITLMAERVPVWWGWLLLCGGLLSGVLGVLWALAQHDLKRLLAYHSVENIGIILIGMGAGALGTASGQPLLAVLGYGGALLHTLNHALFKSLLFLGSGAVVHATGTREIDSLGGLARRMPWTWATFLIASVAIVGLPPLNGFVSEWTIAQALLAGSEGPASLRVLAISLAGLGLIGALALACFTKVDGVIFLGQPRSESARAAQEAGRGQRVPLVLLSALCLGIGLAPGVALAPALRVVASTAAVSSPPPAGALEPILAGALSVTGLGVALLSIIGLLVLVRRLLLARGRITIASTWACGYPAVTSRMQYTAASFAAPLLGMFGAASGIVIERRARTVHTRPVDLVLDRAARPLWDRLQHAAGRLRWMQSGRLHWYLLYVLATLAILLGYLAAGGIR